MRIPDFQQWAIEQYQQAREVTTAGPYTYKDRLAVEIRLANGKAVRHAITRVSVDGEDLDEPEPVVAGEPPAPIEPRPSPAGVRDRDTASFLASILAAAGNTEMAQVYAYSEDNMHPGLGVVFHNGAKIHCLLV